jgi:hypothetical protein
MREILQNAKQSNVAVIRYLQNTAQLFVAIISRNKLLLCMQVVDISWRMRSLYIDITENATAGTLFLIVSSLIYRTS